MARIMIYHSGKQEQHPWCVTMDAGSKPNPKKIYYIDLVEKYPEEKEKEDECIRNAGEKL